MDGQHCKDIMVNLYQMSLKDEYCDTILSLEDGKVEIPCHKCVIISKSPILKNIIAVMPNDPDKTIIDIDNVSPEAMREVVKYIYTGQQPTENSAIRSEFNTVKSTFCEDESQKSRNSNSDQTETLLNNDMSMDLENDKEIISQDHFDDDQIIEEDFMDKSDELDQTNSEERSIVSVEINNENLDSENDADNDDNAHDNDIGQNEEIDHADEEDVLSDEHIHVEIATEQVTNEEYAENGEEIVLSRYNNRKLSNKRKRKIVEEALKRVIPPSEQKTPKYKYKSATPAKDMTVAEINKYLKCKGCHIVFPSKHQLYKHRKECDQGNFPKRLSWGDPPYKCPHDNCNAVKDTIGKIRYHYRAAHMRFLRCPFCPLSMHSKSDLRVHIMRHTGEKPFKCDMCPKGYTNMFELKQHIKNHDKSTRWKNRPNKVNCPTCGLGCPSQHTLYTHIVTVHKNVKERAKIYCEGCAATFTIPANLRKHLKHCPGTEGGQKKAKTKKQAKPFNCEFCDKKYSIKPHYFAHMENEHGVVLTNSEESEQEDQESAGSDGEAVEYLEKQLSNYA